MSISKDLEEWRSLCAHPKWKELCEIGEAQRAVRLAGVINGINDLREEDKQRGEYLGIGLLMSIPQAQIDTLSVELDNLKLEQEDDD